MSDRQFRVTEATQSDTPLLTNLLNLYVHDMSEWFEIDSGPNGLFSYDLADFSSRKHPAFITRYGESPAGFALIQKISDEFDLKEFFILRRYRRSKVGQQLTSFVWQQLPGKWKVRVISVNRPAVSFWRKVISEYTDDTYTEDHLEIDGSSWVHFHFRSDV